MDVVSEGAGRGGPKMWEELVFGVKGNDGKRELLKGRSGWDGRGNDSDGGFDNGRQEVLYWDIREWNTVDDFLELKVDVRVLGFVGGGVLKLRA